MTTNNFKSSSGITTPVWDSTFSKSKFPRFEALSKDITTGICVVGSGISGINVAYEAQRRLNRPVVLIEARAILSGETERTTGHLSSGDQGDRFYNLVSIFGEAGAKLAYESHQYAVDRVGQIAKELDIDCEYRNLSAKIIKAPEAENDLSKEYKTLQSLGIPSSYSEKETVGEDYTGPVLTIEKQGTFHPTKHLAGMVNYLSKQGNFEAYTNTRYVSHKRENDKLQVSVKGNNGDDFTISADSIVLATNMPPYKISHVIKQHYMRTYAIALAMPKDSYSDVLLYDNNDPYVYVRKTAHPDSTKEYLIIGGEDHKVGLESQESYPEHFENLEAWARRMFPFCQTVDYKWSGQIVENSEGLAHIGQTGDPQEYIVTGDNGNGLTHGTLAGKLIVDLIEGAKNPWTDIYSPRRTPLKAGLAGVYETAKENIIQQKEYLRLAVMDVSDIEAIPKCSGRVMREGITPTAVYKSDTGKITKFSALCPHMKGVVAWNPIEQSWDCPNHGSRFSGTTGECVMGPAKMGLHPSNAEAEQAAKGSATV